MELGGKRSRWRSQRNGQPQRNVLTPLLFNVYTNDQPIHPGTHSFVFADDLAVTTQSTYFAPIEETLTSALDGLSEYYTTNQLRCKIVGRRHPMLNMHDHNGFLSELLLFAPSDTWLRTTLIFRRYSRSVFMS